MEVEPVYGGGADQLDGMVRREELAALQAALARLPQQERLVVESSFGMIHLTAGQMGGESEASLREIAEHLQMSHEGVRKLLARGLERLRGLMREHLDD